MARGEYEGATEAERRELDRVGAFSDGVFAIAITLLVLNLEVPDVPAGDLGNALRDLDGNITAYFIGFAVMGRFWYAHHRLFSAIVRTDARLIVVNLLLLSLIALMPFTTALMGRYNETGDEIAVILYALNVGLAACADTYVDKVAFSDGMAPAVSPGVRRAQIVTGWLRPAIFFASIPVALLVSASAAQFFWLTLLLLPAVGRRVERETDAQEAAS